MEVRMAEHLGMCFGVRDAIDLALRLTRQAPITILGDLVHNPDVLLQLDAAGARRAQEPGEIQTRALLVTAHGAAKAKKVALRAVGHQVHDATCPLVKRAHMALECLLNEGRFPVVIGEAEHVEVRGLVGDLAEYVVILDESELPRLAEPIQRNPRVGVVSQTTQPLAHVKSLVAAMRRAYPDADIKFIDTVCQPTKDRQRAMHQLIRTCDVIIVVGGPNSNNSRKLTELAQSLGRPAYQVGAADELRPEWFAGARVVGLSAGTSTPDRAIREVRTWLENMPASSTEGKAE